MDPFNDLYHQHYRLLFNVAYKMCGNRDEAADIVQEVFLALFQNQQQGKQISYPKSWLYRATLNKCSDNSRYRSRFVEMDRLAETGEEVHETDEDRKIVQWALKQLSPKERSLAVMYGEGMSYREMAEITGIRYSSVGKTLTRTLDKLGKILKKTGYEMHQQHQATKLHRS